MLVKKKSVRHWHGIGTLLIWMKPPDALKERQYSCAVKWWVWSSSARASQRRQNSSRRFWIIEKRILDIVRIGHGFLGTLSLLAFLFQLVSQIFFVSWLFPISVSMKSSLLDDTHKDWKKVHRKVDEFPIDLCFCARNARTFNRGYHVQYDKRRCALRFGFRLAQFTKFDVTHILKNLFWFCTAWVKCFIFRRSWWRACRSGWFSIFWINCRTLNLCACFTTECGSPAIRKSMSASFTIICSWLKSSWSTTDRTVLSRSASSPTLNVSLSWAERVWELSDTLITSCVITSRPVRSCACSTLKSFLSSDERVWITLVPWTVFPWTGPVTGRTVRSQELGSLRKELTSISWERDVFLSSYTPITSCVISNRPDLSRIGFRVGWFDWKLPDSCPASARWPCSEPESHFHSCFKRDRCDMCTFRKWLLQVPS